MPSLTAHLPFPGSMSSVDDVTSRFPSHVRIPFRNNLFIPRPSKSVDMLPAVPPVRTHTMPAFPPARSLFNARHTDWLLSSLLSVSLSCISA